MGRFGVRSSLLRRGWENKRLDHYGDGSGGRDQRADVDEIEIVQRDAVDGDHRVLNLQLFLKVEADDSADITVIDQYQRMTLGQNILHPFDHARAEGLQAKKRRRAVPVKSNGRRLAPV